MPTTFFRSTAAVAVVGVGALTFLSAPASGQTCYPPTPGCVTTSSSTPGTTPRITLSDTTVTRGQTISATVSGFQPGTSGIITIASVEQQIGSFTMPATGSTTTSITIPASISLGAHTVFARGTLGGQPASASQGVIVIAGGTGGTTGRSSTTTGSTLARTGAALGAATVVGVGLVAGGMALKRSGRKRPTSTG